MPYVERDAQSRVVRTYQALQPGVAEELLAEDHPDVLMFRTVETSAEYVIKHNMTLDQYKEYRVALVAGKVNDFVDRRYPPHRQRSLMFLHQIGGTDRKAYVQAVWDWMESVLSYYYGLEDDIAAAANKDDVEAIDVSQAQLDTFDAADPEGTIRGAIAITT